MTNEEDGIVWAWRQLVVIKALPAAVRHSHCSLGAWCRLLVNLTFGFLIISHPRSHQAGTEVKKPAAESKNYENMDSGGLESKWNQF